MTTAVAVRERPIIMTGESVRAILDGRKSQTRRVVKGTALAWLAPDMFTPAYVALPENGLCPYGAPGDRLWVRETWQPVGNGEGNPDVYYRADPPWGEAAYMGGWKPSIHMPRWASRLTLEVTGVRVERVQEISEADAIAEGCERQGLFRAESMTARGQYRKLWDSLNAARGFGWDLNPWVWVVEFRPEGLPKLEVSNATKRNEPADEGGPEGVTP